MQVPCFVEFISLTPHTLNLADKHKSWAVYIQPPMHKIHHSSEFHVFYQTKVHVWARYVCADVMYLIPETQQYQSMQKHSQECTSCFQLDEGWLSLGIKSPKMTFTRKWKNLAAAYGSEAMFWACPSFVWAMSSNKVVKVDVFSSKDLCDRIMQVTGVNC